MKNNLHKQSIMAIALASAMTITNAMTPLTTLIHAQGQAEVQDQTTDLVTSTPESVDVPATEPITDSADPNVETTISKPENTETQDVNTSPSTDVTVETETEVEKSDTDNKEETNLQENVPEEKQDDVEVDVTEDKSVQAVPRMFAMLAQEPEFHVSVSLVDEQGNPIDLASTTINIGEISKNAPVIEGYTFVRALVDNTEIKMLAVYNDQVYYSTEVDNVAGTLLGNTKIQLVYKETKASYKINYQVMVDGREINDLTNYLTLDGPDSVEEDSDFSFIVRPENGYTVTSVTQDGIDLKNENDEYYASLVTKDSNVRIDLTEKKEAQITFEGSNTLFKFDGNSFDSGSANNHSTNRRDYKANLDTLSFTLHGHKQYTDEDKTLNKLAISIGEYQDVSIEIPFDTDTAPLETTTKISDEITATVRQTNNRTQESGVKSRTYTVTLSTTKNGLFDDIKVVTNFKDSKTAELFVTQISGTTNVYESTTQKELDPSNPDSSFIELKSRQTYKFYFNVLPGYMDNLSNIHCEITIDGGTPSVQNIMAVPSNDAQYRKYSYYFVIANYSTSDGKDFRVRLSADKADYKIEYEEGTKIEDNGSYADDESFMIPTEIPTNEDNDVFMGWKIDGSDTIYQPGDVIHISEIKDLAKLEGTSYVFELVAVWETLENANSIPYLIKVYKDGNPVFTLRETGVKGHTIQVYKEAILARLEEKGIEISLDEYYLTKNSNVIIEELGKNGVVPEVNLYFEKIQEASELNLVFIDKNVVYDGKNQSLDSATAIEGVTIEYSTNQSDWASSLPSLKNAGTLTVYARANKEGYKQAEAKATLTVEKRSIAIKAPGWDEPYTKPYDGKPLNTFYDDPDNNYVKPEITSKENDDIAFVDGEGFDHFWYVSTSTVTLPNIETTNVIDKEHSLIFLKPGTNLNNYDIEWINGVLLVTDRSDEDKFVLNIKPNGDTRPYTGFEQKISGFTSSFKTNNGESLSGYKVFDVEFKAEGINVIEGGYKVQQTGTPIIKDVDGNDVTSQFKVIIEDAYLNITKVPLTISVINTELPFDEKTHVASEAKVQIEGLVSIHDEQDVRYDISFVDKKIENISAQGEQAEVQITNVEVIDDEITNNYDIEHVKGILSIGYLPKGEYKAEITIGEKSKPYNGEPQSFVEDNELGYSIIFKDKDGKEIEKDWELNKKPEILVNGSQNNMITDAGREYTVSFSNMNDLAFVNENNDEVIGRSDIKVNDGTFSISPVSLTIKPKDKIKPYDGTPLVADEYEIEEGILFGEDKISDIHFSGEVILGEAESSIVDHITISNGVADKTGNYTITRNIGNLNVYIDKDNKPKITIQADSSRKMYDGKSLSTTYSVVGRTLPTDVLQRSKISTKVIGIDQAKFIKPGKATNTIVVDGVDDLTNPERLIYNGEIDVTQAYDIKFTEGQLEITKRPIKLVTGDASKPYDGDPLINELVTLSKDKGYEDLAPKDSFYPIPKASKQIVNAGKTKNDVISDFAIINDTLGDVKNSCYEISYDYGELEITKAPATENEISVDAESLEVTYDGKPHSIKAEAAQEGSTLTYRIVKVDELTEFGRTNPAFVNVGEYTIEVKATHPNYEDSTVTATLTISKRPLTISGGKDTKEYDGNPLTVNYFTFEGLVEKQKIVHDSVSVNASETDVKDEPTEGTIRSSKDGVIIRWETGSQDNLASNYEIKMEAPTVQITPKPITISSEAKEFAYDGKEHCLTEDDITVTTLAEGDEITYLFVPAKEIGSVEKPFSYSFKDDKGNPIPRNYKIMKEDIKPITIYGLVSYDSNNGKGNAPEPDKYYNGKGLETKENTFFKKLGYTFDSWNTENDGSGVKYEPKSNINGLTSNITLYAQWSANTNTPYKLEKYKSDDKGNYSKPYEVDDRAGITDSTVKLSDEDKIAPEGYALDTKADNVFDGKVAADGSLVLKVYFAKDEIGPDGPDEVPDKYQIQFTYVAKENGKVTGTVNEVHTFKGEDGNYILPKPITPKAGVTAVANDGYEIDTWLDSKSKDLGNGEKPEFGEITYKENETFTVSFKELEHVTIKYQAKSHGKVSLDSETLNPETGESKGSKAIADKGYSFDGWYLEDKKLSKDEQFKPSKEDGRYKEATYVAKFVPNTDTEYVVEQYFEKDGKYADKADKSFEYKGTTGKEVSVSQKDMAAPTGYVLDENADNLFTGKVAADGSLVLKVYFAKDEIGPDGPDEIPDKYQVQFTYVAKENGKVTGTVNEVHTFKDKDGNYVLPTPVTPNAEVKAIANDGYEIDIWKDASGLELGNKENPEFADKKYSRSQIFTVSFKEKSETEKPKPETESDKPDDDKKNDEKDDKKDEVNTSTQTNRSLFTAMAISALGAIGILNFLKKKKED